MNLHDIVPVATRSTTSPPAAETQKLSARVTAARGWHETEDAPYGDRAAHIVKRLNTERLAFYQRHGVLPPAARETLFMRGNYAQYGEDTVTRVADAPKVSLDKMRQLATAFGFPIIPYEYVDARARRPAERFEAELSPLGFTTYILGPLPLYSVVEHMNADEDAAVFSAGTALSGALLTIPAFRALKRELREMQTNVHARMERLEGDVRGLQKQVESMRAEVAEARVRESRARASAERTRVERALLEYDDPVALSLPPGTDILSDGWAVLGPCWGPDFEEILAKAFGYKLVQGQRARLATSSWSSR